ncbi:type 1 glutamine amidotransferase domain-containing protein [Marivibrio halodurans]|uniref:Type 1 glutamine amidotransferase domain-containing protein n=1 Tax=Marivibrio halodurans TaxID=2039722 RepID=A0A8J7SP01_9PROT|nr:type 1 glutamine amidotransferase domain-containing protein [Marivibrio halodurans]MBP5858318.1 type 1 glutamine amidotransferase domain-containing protein [Marivibrio halodurans]
MADEKRILFVTTSHDRLGDTGKATGFHLEELTHPFYALKDAGHTVDIASVAGGEAPIDPGSRKPDGENAESAERFLKDDTAMAAIRQTVKIADVNPDSYDAIYLPGGHGTMWDMPDNETLARLIGAFHQAGKPVAAVCHGPAGLVGAVDGEGRPIVRGRTVNSFTDAEEKAVELQEVVPFLLESRLRELGATFEGGDSFSSHAVRDGNLITGQNPMSLEALSAYLLEALREAPVRRAA